MTSSKADPGNAARTATGKGAKKDKPRARRARHGHTSVEGGYAKVSLTIPRAAAEAARERAGERGLSAYVAAALEHQLRRDALLDWARQMDAEYGPVPAADLKAARALLLGEAE